MESGRSLPRLSYLGGPAVEDDCVLANQKPEDTAHSDLWGAKAAAWTLYCTECEGGLGRLTWFWTQGKRQEQTMFKVDIQRCLHLQTLDGGPRI